MYEGRARGQMNSLRSSQISTHLGLDGRRRSPALSTREQPDRGSVAPPSLSGQGPSVKSGGVEVQDRYSLLDHQTAEDFNV